MRTIYKVCLTASAAFILVGASITCAASLNGNSIWTYIREDISQMEIGSSSYVATADVGTEVILEDMSENVIETGTASEQAVAVNIDKLHEIYVDIGAGRLKITEGDELKVYIDPEIEEYVEVNIGENSISIDNTNNEMFNLFGWSGEKKQQLFNKPIVLEIPKGTNIDNVSLNLGLGDMSIDNLSADNLEVSVGAGVLKADSISVLHNADISVDAGDLKIKELISDSNTSLNLGSGRIDISGKLIGNTEIDCGIGTIDLDIEGKEEDYGYTVDTGIGTVKVNNHKFSNSDEEFGNNDASNMINVSCGIGTVDIKIK